MRPAYHPPKIGRMMPRQYFDKNLKLKLKLKFTIIVITIFLGLFLLLNPFQVSFAQSPFTAQVDRNTVARNEQVTLTLRVTGDFLNTPNPDLSELQDFVVVSSSTSTQVSIVNGQMSSQKVFIYRLQPLKEGKLVIDPLSIHIGGQFYQTDPIEIEVLPGGTQVSPPDTDIPDTDTPKVLSGQDFFVEADVDNPAPYLGEQIIYIFRIYQAVQFPPGQPDYQPPPFTDFWNSEILTQPTYNTEASGRRYLVTEIRTALFPANLGSIKIEPSSLVVPGGLFNPDVRLETNPVTVEVRPLPTDPPDDFSGAVGQFEIRASLSETETKINEPVTLLVEIEGTGNIQTLTEPALPELPDWRLFESRASTVINNHEDLLSGIRSFERLIVPGQSGEQIFPPISFSYYNPQVETYQTINTDPIPLTVLPDDSVPVPLNIDGAGADDKPSIDRVALDIRHIKPVPTLLTISFDTSLFGWIAYWSCWLFPALLVGAVYVWQGRQRRLREDTAYARDQRARRVALKILTDARQAGDKNSADAVGRALLGYLSDKLNTPTAGLTTADLVKLLGEARLQENLIYRIETLLHQIDIGRYAPITDESTQSMLDDTLQLINDLEKSIGKRR